MKRLLTLSLALLLAACSSIELDETNPSNVNLDGTWILDFANSDDVPDMRDGLNRPKQRQPRNPREAQISEIRGAIGSGLAFIVHDFEVLRADKMEIELNPDSMGIRYFPGVYRDVSWGERQRGLWEVYAGWELGDLVILSRAPDLRVMERMQLSGDRLTVQVEIKADDEQRTLTRVFRRGRE